MSIFDKAKEVINEVEEAVVNFITGGKEVAAEAEQEVQTVEQKVEEAVAPEAPAQDAAAPAPAQDAAAPAPAQDAAAPAQTVVQANLELPKDPTV